MARYVNWKGERKQKCKRGFATKKEAQEWERMFQIQNSSDLDMSFEAFMELYIWGQRHKRYLQEHKRATYANLLTSDKLNSYLADIDEQAEELFSRLVKQMAEREGVTETLKAENQMLWVQKINNIRNRAMEIVYTNLIYA